MLYSYKRTCFTGTKVHILTQKALLVLIRNQRGWQMLMAARDALEIKTILSPPTHKLSSSTLAMLEDLCATQVFLIL